MRSIFSEKGFPRVAWKPISNKSLRIYSIRIPELFFPWGWCGASSKCYRPHGSILCQCHLEAQLLCFQFSLWKIVQGLVPLQSMWHMAFPGTGLPGPAPAVTAIWGLKKMKDLFVFPSLSNFSKHINKYLKISFLFFKEKSLIWRIRILNNYITKKANSISPVPIEATWWSLKGWIVKCKNNILKKNYKNFYRRWHCPFIYYALLPSLLFLPYLGLPGSQFGWVNTEQASTYDLRAFLFYIYSYLLWTTTATL